MTALKQRIRWEPKPARSLDCPACGVSGSKPFVLEADPSWDFTRQLDLFACPACGSKFFPDLEIPEYEVAQDLRSSLKFYLEIGAGIDLLASPTYVAPIAPGDRYLEIGCGFGFGLDFARHARGLDVLGVDPSPFAAAGSEQFGLPVLHDYLTPSTDLGGRRFRMAVASEVIEHIREPLPFLKLIADRLSDDGTLFLTTPDAASVVPATSPGVLLPLLSTGWHYILFSAESLRRLLEQAGFKRIEVGVRQHSLIAAATNGSGRIDLGASVDRNTFQAYLERRRGEVAKDGWLQHGLDYRLLKDLVNTGRYGRALEVYGDIRAALQRIYAIDLDAPGAPWLTLPQDETFDSLALRLPMTLCGIGYLRGVLALNHENAPASAAHYFAMSVRAGDALRRALDRIGADDAETEVFLERSRALLLRAKAHAAPMEAAREALALYRTPPGTFAAAQADAELASLLTHLVNLGAFEAAEVLAPEAARLIAPDYKPSGKPLDDVARHELHHALGMLSLNHRGAAAQAALHFARAERFARRHLSRQPLASRLKSEAWKARYHRLLALTVATDARRATTLARRFSRTKAGDAPPGDVASQAQTLLRRLEDDSRPR